MAGVAGYYAPPAEVGSIDGVHHHDHFARSLLKRRVVGIPGPTAAAFLDMALNAVHAGGRGKEPHRAHEFLDGNSPEQLDVCEHVFRHLRLRFWCSLPSWASLAAR